MKNLNNLNKILIGLSTLGCLSAIANVPAAQAQPAYGSYVGVGASFGFTSGNTSAGESSRTSGLVAARYKFLEFPVSVRAQILIGNSTAVVPTVSFDVPLNFDTDIYIGAGVSLSNTVDTTPVGNKNSFVIQPGIDYTLPNSNLVLFGNVIFAFDAYRNSSGTSATSLQTGLGLRF
ncbi:porin family protein [Pseudanabaena sp. UWO310]|uniref:porin family protein n=1 Tax=Pseudanabaena sp. UWO310 TaxID=2480795 RepID=UPI001159EDEC|nr:porin family protein [Pseudanabaena sp. UWO310]TYQ30774.1 porin family protein [Pseudanabaena sp. UWO310]